MSYKVLYCVFTKSQHHEEHLKQKISEKMEVQMNTKQYIITCWKKRHLKMYFEDSFSNESCQKELPERN